MHESELKTKIAFQMIFYAKKMCGRTYLHFPAFYHSKENTSVYEQKKRPPEIWWKLPNKAHFNLFAENFASVSVFWVIVFTWNKKKIAEKSWIACITKSMDGAYDFSVNNIHRIYPLEKSIHGIAANESDKQKIGTKWNHHST